MIYRFENTVINTEKRTISKDDENLAVEPKLFSLLIYFCENANRALSRDELIKAVWQDRIVSEAAVNRAIAQLRKHIEIDTANLKLIITVSKVGYTFTSKVEKITNTSKQEPQSGSKKHIKLWFLCMLLVPLLFIGLLIFNKKQHVTSIRKVSLLSQQSITDSKELSFNPSFDKPTETTYYLFRNDKTKYSQIKSFNKQSESQITNDDHYYTDVISIDENTLLAARLNNLQTRDCEIIAINKQNLKTRKVVDCGKAIVSHLGYVPKTNIVIYRYREIASQPYSIYATSLASLRTQKLTHPTRTSNGSGHITYAVSPRGNQLAVIEYQTENYDNLKVFNISTQSKLDTFSLPKNLSSITWLLEDLLIASNNNQLFSIDLNNKVTTIIETPTSYGRLAAKSEMQLLTEKSEEHINLELVDFNGNSSIYTTQIEGLIGSFAPANNSNQVIFHSKMKQLERVLLQKSDNQIIDTLFPKKLKYTANFEWSNDDKYIIASVNGNAYLFTVANLSWQKIKIPFKSIHHVSFIDNNNILFSTETNSDWNLWSFNLTSKQTNQLTSSEVYTGKMDYS